MRRFQCAALAAVAVIGFVSTAAAADMPVKAPAYNAPVAYDWTGFYVGINGAEPGLTRPWLTRILQAGSHVRHTPSTVNASASMCSPGSMGL